MRNLRMIGPPRHTQEDKKFARKIQQSLGLEPMDEPYDETIVEIDRSYDGWHPADDVNEFTWHAPTARVYVSKSLASIPGFRYPRWVVSALCGTGATHRMGEMAAKVLASSAVELVTAPGLLKQAKEEFDERQRQQQIEPLVPLGLEPPIYLRWPEWVDRPGSEWWIPS